MRNKTNVLLVYPSFSGPSFWNFRETCELAGARYPAPPLGLITIAAMLPKTWNIRLVDCNVEKLDPAAIDWADLVMTGGMLPQQLEALRVIDLAHAAGKLVAVGGPDPTSSPELYTTADFRVLGEAEGVLGQFIAAWEAGETKGDFEAPKFQADVTSTPIPRFDLLKFDNYLFIGLQYSRGCPFTCEFCDIIELYGRVPRTKTTEQMLAELDALYELGYRGHVDFVDDNLIGNKKAVKAFLPHLIAWQKARRYPFEFSTEASLNLADDAALLNLLSEAGFFTIFVGIESPDEDVLRMAQKKQNTRRDIAESVHKIYAAGIVVVAGFIVGFDNEGAGVGRTMSALIKESMIPVSMVGLLYALPNTQLTRRLEREGRLFVGHDENGDEGLADQCIAGLNFVTLRPRVEILKDYRQVVASTFASEAFFDRLHGMSRLLKYRKLEGGLNPGRAWVDARRFVNFMARSTFRHPRLALRMWRMIGHGLLTNPQSLPATVKMAMLYAHLGPFSRYICDEISLLITAMESGTWVAPEIVPPKADAACGRVGIPEGHGMHA